jgi:hypothetical protein
MGVISAERLDAGPDQIGIRAASFFTFRLES